MYWDRELGGEVEMVAGKGRRSASYLDILKDLMLMTVNYLTTTQ